MQRSFVGCVSDVDQREAREVGEKAVQYAKEGIRVNTVAPGLIDTPIYGSGEASEAFKAQLQKGVLFPQKLGKPEQLASMVLECITNSYMNAETIRVDGGIRMPPK